MYLNNKATTLLLLFLYSFSFAQSEIDILSPKKMQKDLEILMETLDGHPDPFTQISESELNDIVEKVKENISIEMDEIDFYKNLSSIIASIGDGHSRVRMPKSWLKNLRKKNGVFPFEVFLKNDGELYIIESYGEEEQIPKGSQIIDINGMPVDDFINTVTPFISYETIPFRNDQISQNFELMLYLVFKQVGDLKIKFKVAKESEVTISTIEYKSWVEVKKDLREEREKKIAIGKPYDYNIIQPGIAKIDIFSFAIYDFKKYNLFLLKTFKNIKKNNIHSLIIDVRGNYGGWPKVASGIFHYIDEGHFKTMAKSSMKISNPYRRYFTDKNPYLRTAYFSVEKRKHYLDIQKILKGKIDSYVEEDIFFNESPITKEYEFTGDCYLLIDRKSYSASSSFASTFQCYSMGYLIGEPTGGTKIFRANAFYKTLPKSNFRVSMSTTKLYTACYDGENEPVIPNIEARQTILEKVHSLDSQLNTTLRLINKIQKERAKLNK